MQAADNSDSFATFEEAEYTPSLAFSLAICAAMWACRTGKVIAPVPRLPPISRSGDIRPLLHFEPADLRDELMDIMGFHLGLRPPGRDSHNLPVRVEARSVVGDERSKPADVVYIGHGHFSHRWPPGKWQSPFQVGRDCGGADAVIKYAQWIVNQTHLLDSLRELHGMRLACD